MSGTDLLRPPQSHAGLMCCPSPDVVEKRPLDKQAESREITTGRPDSASAGLFRAVTHRLGLSKAVAYSVLLRVWQLLTGPITSFYFLVQFFSPAARDYYFAFSSMLGVQVFLELGLHVVIINVTSHEWSQLKWEDGRLTGDVQALSRLSELRRLTDRWYAAAAVLFLLAVSFAGYQFFDSSAGAGDLSDAGRAAVDWQGPWLILTVLTSVQLCLLSRTSILEGCNHVESITRVRFWQALAGTASVWLLMALGLQLWALAASAAVRLTGDLYLVYGSFGSFFRQLSKVNATDSLSWKDEVLPLQWRIAVQSVFSWLALQMPILYVFRELPAGDASRLGLTWSLLTAGQGAAMAWVETRRPVFGILIAARRYAALDRLFIRLTTISSLLMAALGGALLLLILLIGQQTGALFQKLSDSLLPLPSAGLLALGFVIVHPALCSGQYVRAHKRDPYLFAASFSSLCCAVLQVASGRQWGTAGVALGYCLAVCLVQTPLLLRIWWRCRREWH